MIIQRPAAERGLSTLSWLNSRHSFSFNHYYDPKWVSFRTLRVINDDVVAPGGGFGTHGHQDMEIVSWVLDGALKHQDSSGSIGEIKPGEVQRMSAGTGIYHSEFNASSKAPVRFLQIWIVPGKKGLAPGYEQKSFAPAERLDRLRVIASPDGRENSVTIAQDVVIYDTVLRPGATVEHAIAAGRAVWGQVATGEVVVNGVKLRAGDGIALTDEAAAQIVASQASEVLLFDLK
jgi:redox-sensitive bicupin YhaK (pirin superfamily)